MNTYRVGRTQSISEYLQSGTTPKHSANILKGILAPTPSDQSHSPLLLGQGPDVEVHVPEDVPQTVGVYVTDVSSKMLWW